MLIEEACGIPAADLMIAAGPCQDQALWAQKGDCRHGEEDLEHRAARRMRSAPDETRGVAACEPTPSGRRSNRTDRPNGLISNLASPKSRGGRESDQVKMFRRILPHIRQFIEIRDALAGARALNAAFAELLDNRVAGVICVERSGKVVHTNSLARAILRHRDGLMQDRDGYLRARLPAEDARLRGLVTRALTPSTASGAAGLVAIRRSPGLAPLTLHVTPVVAHGPGSRRSRVASMVLIVVPAAKQVADPKNVAAALGLTLAESLVACSTVDGATAREIAAATSRRESTVRELLKRVHVKLGISRRADLVRAVLSIGAIPITAGWRSKCQEDA